MNSGNDRARRNAGFSPRNYEGWHLPVQYQLMLWILPSVVTFTGCGKDPTTVDMAVQEPRAMCDTFTKDTKIWLPTYVKLTITKE